MCITFRRAVFGQSWNSGLILLKGAPRVVCNLNYVSNGKGAGCDVGGSARYINFTCSCYLFPVGDVAVKRKRFQFVFAECLPSSLQLFTFVLFKKNPGIFQ